MNLWPPKRHGLVMPGAAVLTLLLTVAACQPPSRSATGTLEVHVADHRVAIGDFESLKVTLASLDVHPAGHPRTEGWLALAPQVAVLDLTEYVGGREATVLTTALPAGDYDAVRLVVSTSKGVLKTGGTAIVLGFEEATVVKTTIRGGQTTTLLLEVIVQSAADHPGGGYEMHLVSATTKSDARNFLPVGAGLILLAIALGGAGFVAVRRRKRFSMVTPTSR